MEVADLEDEIIGLNTRIENVKVDIKSSEENISTNKTRITDAKALIKKYEKQLDNVKNNREFDALNKEIEIQELEVLAAEKRIKNSQFDIENKNIQAETIKSELEGRNLDMTNKKSELEMIVEETEKEEKNLLKSRGEASDVIENRLLISYNKVRASVKNGIGVAMVIRDSCGGCFAKIPPQRQSDIKQRKKILVCEHCGRVLVDGTLAEEVNI
jgi:predicted  nucleic acid-binding Zn-ribbon protein